MIDLKVNGKNEVMGPGNQNRNTAHCLPLGVLENTAGEARDGIAWPPTHLSGLAPFPGCFSSRQGANMNQLEQLLFY